MSSMLQSTSGGVASAAVSLPFESYAQLVRMLIPSAQKICFYDRQQCLWNSDGIEEDELRMHVQVVLARAADRARGRAEAGGVSDEEQPATVIALRSATGRVLGGIALVLRDLPATASYRRAGTIERLLAPLIDVIVHAWRDPESDSATLHPVAREIVPMPLDATIALIAAPAERSAPAILRRALAKATDALHGAFGALVVPQRAFTLTHRISPDESELGINAAIDYLRKPMARLLHSRKEPLAVNSADPDRVQIARYKFLVCPLRTENDRLAALLILFRRRQQADFSSDDCASLQSICAQIPASMLTDLAPPPAAQPEPRPIVRAANAADAPAQASTELARGATTTHEPHNGAARTSSSACIAPAAIRRVEIPPEARSQLPMEERIRAALRSNAFYLYAQRIASLRDDSRAARFEVLLRMRDADTLRTPQAFLAAAAANHLLPDLDRWVISNLLKTLRSSLPAVRAGHKEFSINLSAQSLAAEQFGAFVESQIFRSGVPPQLLVFEIAERDVFENRHTAEYVVHRLHDLGCRISLDNCREGLQTFGPIRRWPVSCLKIDAALTQGIDSDPLSAHVVGEVAEVACDIGIETVGECVESEGVRTKLSDLRIDFAQGFHLARPQPLGDVLR